MFVGASAISRAKVLPFRQLLLQSTPASGTPGWEKRNRRIPPVPRELRGLQRDRNVGGGVPAKEHLHTACVKSANVSALRQACQHPVPQETIRLPALWIVEVPSLDHHQGCADVRQHVVGQVPPLRTLQKTPTSETTLQCPLPPPLQFPATITTPQGLTPLPSRPPASPHVCFYTQP